MALLMRPAPTASVTNGGGTLRASWRNLPVLVISVTVVALGARYFRFISRNAVNVFFYDQWDYLTDFFQGHATLAALFLRQHGPHREGIGLIADLALYSFTRWSTRAESFMIGGCVFCALLLALLLKRKLFGRYSYSDVAIPLIFLTLMQYETFIGTPNPAYSGFPLVLMMLYCLVLLKPNYLLRYGLILLINVVLIYTGFGLLMGPVTVGLFALECYARLRHTSSTPLAPSVGALLLACVSLAAFFVHYSFANAPAVDCFVFPYRDPSAYPRFMAMMFSTFLGFLVPNFTSLTTTVLGMILVVTMAAVLVLQVYRFAQGSAAGRSHLIVAVLLGYGLLFSANTAIGRICLGLPGAAQVSRYSTLLIPAFFGLYLYLQSLSSARIRTVALALLLVLLLHGALRDPAGARWFTDGKRAWVACYLKSANIPYCDQAAHFAVYPVPSRTHLAQKLDYLKQRRLSFFADAAPK